MKIKHLLPLQRIIGKIDNDFNIDNSDWIPRVAAWTIDALSQMRCTPYTWKKFKCEVDDDGIVHCPKILDAKSIRVYNQHGCLIDNAKGVGDNSITLTHIRELNSYQENTSYGGGSTWTEEEIAMFGHNPDVQDRIRVGHVCRSHIDNFVVIDDDKLQVNFTADFVVVEMYAIATYYDDYFNEEVPFIYDNGLLLEAVCWYCMMKILQRGYKHQVFSLSGNEAVNPYIQWNKLKDNAAISVKRDLRDPSKNEGWNNFFYNATFLPRG